MVQVEGHAELLPLHTNGEHEGLPDAPAVLLAQMPTEPAMLQASHAPPHALLQHTPSTQNPLVHALLPLHAVPLPSFATHVVPLQ
jgi:hypothetical protein